MDGSDVYRRAKRLVEEYGADASAHAARQAELMLEHGDMEAFAVWKRIVRAIREIRKMEGHAEH